MNKKTKWIIVSTCGLILVGGGIAIFNQKTEQAQAEVLQQETQKSLKEAKQNMELLYNNDKKELLANSITDIKIQAAKKSIKNVDPKALSTKEEKSLRSIEKQVDFAKEMFAIQSTIKEKIQNDLIVSENVEFSKEAKELKSLEKEKPLFVKNMTTQIDTANQQVEIRKSLMTMFNDFEKKEVKSDISRTDYDNLKAKLDSQSSDSFKDSLNSYFELVLKSIDDRESKEKSEQAKVEDEKKTEATKEEASGSSASTGGNSTSASNGASNGNSTGSSASSSENTGNSTSQAPSQQGGIEGLIASSPTGQRTDQIVGVVGSGSSATVYLFEKNGGQWQTILSSGGHVGAAGIGAASEGSRRTPKGSYSLGFSFGTSNPGTQLPFRAITPNSYWISNVNDSQYNTWQERPSSDPADEHLSDYPVQYQYGIVINYNNGVGGGSGFFLHCDNGMATLGCVSVPTGTMATLMQRIHSGASIINVNSQSELANY